MISKKSNILLAKKAKATLQPQLFNIIILSYNFHSQFLTTKNGNPLSKNSFSNSIHSIGFSTKHSTYIFSFFFITLSASLIPKLVNFINTEPQLYAKLKAVVRDGRYDKYYTLYKRYMSDKKPVKTTKKE